jgi:hypothetical protein
MPCFFRGVAARAHGDDAAKRCRNRQRHNRRIELERRRRSNRMRLLVAVVHESASGPKQTS